MFHYHKVASISKIQEYLAVDRRNSCKKSLCLLLKKYRMSGSVVDYQTGKPLRKLIDKHYRFIDDCMEEDNELTAANIHAKLKVTLKGLSN